MTPEEQRIAMAEACGWNYIDSKTIYPRGIKDGVTLELPDYLNDLNAMHDAENTVIKPQRLWYQYCLRLEGRSFDESIGATASQRAEAFLRTIGKWEETK